MNRRQLTVALALASACIFIASCSGTPRTVAADDLDGLLLSPAEIEIAMNANGITVNGTSTEMSDDSANIPDQDCRFIDAPAEAPVYNGSGWRAVRSRYLNDVDWAHQVWQAVVSFPSANDAARFFGASVQRWPACSNRLYHYINDPGQPDTVWTVGPVVKISGTLSATRGGEGGACQRALTVSNNIAIDVAACPNNPGNTAVKIADQIAAKVAKLWRGAAFRAPAARTAPATTDPQPL
jgi:serine/threonine-protein kinase